MFQTNRAGEALFAVSRARASARTQSPCYRQQPRFRSGSLCSPEARACTYIVVYYPPTYTRSRPTDARSRTRARRCAPCAHAPCTRSLAYKGERRTQEGIIATERGPRERSRALWNAQRAHAQGVGGRRGWVTQLLPPRYTRSRTVESPSSRPPEDAPCIQVAAANGRFNLLMVGLAPISW